MGETQWCTMEVWLVRLHFYRCLVPVLLPLLKHSSLSLFNVGIDIISPILRISPHIGGCSKTVSTFSCIDPVLGLGCIGGVLDRGCIGGVLDCGCIDGVLDRGCIDGVLDLTCIDPVLDLGCIDPLLERENPVESRLLLLEPRLIRLCKDSLRTFRIRDCINT